MTHLSFAKISSVVKSEKIIWPIILRSFLLTCVDPFWEILHKLFLISSQVPMNHWNHAKRSEVAIRLTWWNPSVCLSPRFLCDLNHWCGLHANDEAISTTGLRVRACQALYYQQRSLFRTLLALHHSVVVSIGALVGPNLAFSTHHDLTKAAGNN